MTDTPVAPETEPTEPAEGRRVSRRPSEDRDIREQRRDLISTLLLSRTPYRQMIEILRDQLGIHVSMGTVASDVAVLRQRWGARMTANFGEHVAEQMAYYDALLRAVTPRALRGDHNAVQDLLGVLDRRAKLVGMDQPDKVLVGAVVHTTDVAAQWASAPRDVQVARTEQILAILADALPANGQPVIDVASNGHAQEATDE